jgi:hypothetical protein
MKLHPDTKAMILAFTIFLFIEYVTLFQRGWIFTVCDFLDRIHSPIPGF